MDRWRGKVAVVTGASVGIGASIAEHLVEEGLQVVGLARRSELVRELAQKLQDKKGKLHAVETDISKEEDVLKAFKWISDYLGPVHILINNAGINLQNYLIDGDSEKWKRVLNINVLGLCIATRDAMKIMKTSETEGHIIHINSVVGHKVPNAPGINVYPASKHAVTALTETLRQEINHLGLQIKITSISPGMVNTKFRGNAPVLQAEDIADSVLYVLSTPPHVQVHELTIKPVGEKM